MNSTTTISVQRFATAQACTFALESVPLPNGRRATILVEYESDASVSAFLPRLPEASEWVEPLTLLAEHPESLPGREVLKHSRTGEVMRSVFSFRSGPISVICKRSASTRWPRRFLPGLLPSRERCDWRKSLQLLTAGIPTALPLALLERGVRGSKAWLVTAAIPNATDLDQLVLMHLPRLALQEAFKIKAALVQPLVSLFARFEKAGLYHRDLKASNILVTGWTDSPQVWVVDLEGVRKRRPGGKQRWQPLVRLAASLLGYDMVTRSDHARFLRVYLGALGRPGENWKTRYRDLAVRAGVYKKESRKRKDRKLDGYD